MVAQRDAGGRFAAERIYNSLIVVGDKGQILGSYDKVHLVPFGEYLPFQDFMESLGFLQLTGIRGGFSAGTGSRLLSIPGARRRGRSFATRSFFPTRWSTIRRDLAGSSTSPTMRGSARAQVLISIFIRHNFAPSSKACRVVRAANTGISAIIDPYGRVLGELGLKQEGVVDGLLPEALPTTKFVMWGRWIELAVLSLALVGYLAFSHWQVNQSGPTRNE